MSEITKMYENAGVKPDHYHCEGCEYEYEDICPDDCPNSQAIYPQFTAEKQIELIKWLIKEVDTLQMWYFSHKLDCYDFDLGSRNSTAETFEDCLARTVNNLWQDLTEEECKQIKEILE